MVAATVCGIRETRRPASVRSTIVRLTPSIVTEPCGTLTSTTAAGAASVTTDALCSRAMRDHGADAVDVALHQVPAEARLQREGALEVEPVAGPLAPQRGAPHRLGHGVGPEPVARQARHREARPAGGDRVAHARAVRARRAPRSRAPRSRRARCRPRRRPTSSTMPVNMTDPSLSVRASPEPCSAAPSVGGVAGAGGHSGAGGHAGAGARTPTTAPFRRGRRRRRRA